jgi:plasmid stability protein
MATLNVKNFPDKLYARLQTRAKREHRSVSREVVHLLSRAIEEPAPPSIMDLRGLGKEIWKGIDPGRYVDEERRSWD